MKEGWQIKKLGDVSNLMTGGTPSRNKSEYFSGGEIKWLVSGDIHKGEIHDCEGRITEEGLRNSNAKYLPINSVLIALNGQGKTRGTVAILRTAATCNQSLVSIYPKSNKELLPEYIYCYLHSQYENIRIITGDDGNDRRGLNMPLIRNIDIPIPPLPEQQRIVAILDEAFAAIDKAKANAEQNLKNAKELFESYLQGVFTNRGGGTEIALGKIAEVIGGHSFKSTEFKPHGRYQVIRMGNVRPGIIRPYESPVFINDLEDKVLKKALLLPNDVIITQTGTKNKRDYGFTAIIQEHNYLLNQRIAAIRCSKSILPQFILYFSWTNLFKDHFFAKETGTVGQGNVGISAIIEAKVPYLSIAEQQGIVEKLDTLSAECKKLESIYQKKIDDLEELKKSILQKAFSGELKTVEEAVGV